MHLPLFCTMGVWQPSGTGLSIILSHGTTNSGTCDPQTSSNTSQWVLICSRCLWARSNNTALAPGRASCCCFCGEGGKEGKELTALKREGLPSYLCKPPPPPTPQIPVMEVLQSLSLWRTQVVHILPLGRKLSHLWHKEKSKGKQIICSSWSKWRHVAT